jgi:hypothetical protein
MMKYLPSQLLILVSLILTGCGNNSFDSDLNTDYTQGSNVFPPKPQETWQSAFHRHQEAVKKLQPDPLDRYFITEDNELLITHPVALEATIRRDKPFSWSGTDGTTDLENEDLYFTFQNNGAPWPVIIVNGEIFSNNRRIYDVNLLKRFLSDNPIDIASFISESARVGVYPNDEDKELLEYFRENLPNSLETLKNAFSKKFGDPSDVSDLSQRQSFKDVRQATDTTGQLSIDGQVSTLPLLMFASFDSTLSDPNSKLSSLALKMGSHYVGTVVAGTFETTPITPQHFESSAVYGFSFNKGFVEAQMGSFFDESSGIQSTSGQRYQLTLGFDTDYVTPFVRMLNRTTANDSLTLMGGGLESSIANYKHGESTIDATLSTSYLTNVDGTAIGYASYRLLSTFSDSSVLSISTDYDTLKGLGWSINASIER